MKAQSSCVRLISCVAVVCVAAAAADDPRLASWLAPSSVTYARLYTSDAAKTAGTPVTTWSRGQGTQSTPAYAGVAQVSSSADWVYLRTSGLGLHTMGPWYLDTARTQNFPNFPANTATIYRVPRLPTVPGAKTLTGLGAIGYFVDGVAMFDNRDSFSYSNASGRDADPTNGLTGDGIWTRDAFANEGVTFDPANAHQAGATYHYHANPPALRYRVGDHVTYNATTKTYAESTATPTHSPILGWVRDGYPIYGPYGYANASSATSGVRRMISGYVKRDGTNGTTNLAVTGRTTLPAWAGTAQGRGTTLTGTQSGPAISTAYALGHYLEDFDYLGDLGKTQGVDFDLDLYNGRFCVTPEFPGGIYAYFVAIEADGTPKFPYNIGRWFYGSPTGSTVTAITETVTAYSTGGPAAAITVNAAAAGSGVLLTWASVEGATYKVESSGDGTNWTVLTSSVTSAGATSTYTAAAPANQFRVTVTAVATYDTRGTVGTPVGTTGTASFTVAATTPVITTAPAAVATGAGGTAVFSVTATGAGPLSFQWQKDTVAIPGATNATLTLSGVQAAQAGAYRVVVTNSLGNATSDPVMLTLVSGAYAVVGSGYVAGGTITLGQTIVFSGTLAQLGWQLLLPAGWSFASSNATGTASAPAAGASSLAEWIWTNVPASPVTLRCVLNVPAGTTGPVSLNAIVTGRRTDGSTFQVLAQPDPLSTGAANPATWHSADSDLDGRISLGELTRVIELYNHRTGSLRDGKYHVDPTGEDGFAPGP